MANAEVRTLSNMLTVVKRKIPDLMLPRRGAAEELCKPALHR